MTPVQATVKQSCGNLQALRKEFPAEMMRSMRVKQRKQRQKEITALEGFAEKVANWWMLTHLLCVIISMFCMVLLT